MLKFHGPFRSPASRIICTEKPADIVFNLIGLLCSSAMQDVNGVSGMEVQLVNKQKIYIYIYVRSGRI